MIGVRYAPMLQRFCEKPAQNQARNRLPTQESAREYAILNEDYLMEQTRLNPMKLS